MSESEKYLFGYEAQAAVLTALGIDPEAVNGAIQHITVELGYQLFPEIHIQLAPEARVLLDPSVQQAFKGIAIVHDTDGVTSEAVELIRALVRNQIKDTIHEIENGE
jgi:hypothetical protein